MSNKLQPIVPLSWNDLYRFGYNDSKQPEVNYPHLNGSLLHEEGKPECRYIAQYVHVGNKPELGILLSCIEDGDDTEKVFVDIEKCFQVYEVAKTTACSIFEKRATSEAKRLAWLQKFKMAEGAKELLQKMAVIIEASVRYYKTDFYLYDVPTIAARPKGTYYWITREFGTYLLAPDDIAVVNREEHKKAIVAIAEYWRDTGEHPPVYEIENGKIRKCSYDEMIEALKEVEVDDNGSKNLPNPCRARYQAS